METQFHNIELNAKGVDVHYSLVDDEGTATINHYIPQQFLLDFIKAGEFNILEEGVELNLEMFYAENYYEMAKLYILEAHTNYEKYAV